jgi:hypothetical protein
LQLHVTPVGLGMYYSLIEEHYCTAIFVTANLWTIHPDACAVEVILGRILISK